MKIRTSFLLFFIIIRLGLQGQSTTSSSTYTTNIIVDGRNNEWANPPGFFDSESGFAFDIANDSAQLYLYFSLNDAMKIRKIFKAGWSIELSSGEKNKKFASTITFPLMTHTGEGYTPDKSKRRTENSALYNSYKSQFNSITAAGFRKTNGELNFKDSLGIDAAMGSDSLGNVFFEVEIPLSELYDKRLVKYNEVITLKVTENALDAPAGASDNSRPANTGGSRGGGGGMHGGGGGMHGGGANGMGGTRTGGGGSGSHANVNASNYEKVSFKQKFKLEGKMRIEN